MQISFIENPAEKRKRQEIWRRRERREIMAAMVRPPQLAVSLMRCTKLKALDLSLNSMREGAGLLSQDNLKLLLQAGVYTPIGWPQIVLPAVKNVTPIGWPQNLACELDECQPMITTAIRSRRRRCCFFGGRGWQFGGRGWRMGRCHTLPRKNTQRGKRRTLGVHGHFFGFALFVACAKSDLRSSWHGCTRHHGRLRRKDLFIAMTKMLTTLANGQKVIIDADNLG